ncbi:MAG: FGGY-family carbohydrate kinase, partial [Chloroflexota bacterium]|nr:FGGY-family carbohydrate kinase [Chloroflexota bacterium]
LADVLADPHVASSVDVLTVTASAGCLVPMRSDGSTLGNAIMISDVRASQQAARIEASAAFRSLRNGRVRVTPDLVLPKILWLREEEPERFGAANWFATPNDFLLHRLTGELVTDQNNASKYLYDIAAQEYPHRLLAELGIDRATLPRVVAPGTTSLPLLDSVRRTFGLPDGARAVVSTYDAICAVYGAGVARVGDSCDVSGTVTSFRALTDSIPNDETGRLFTAPHLTSGLFLTGGSNNLGGGVIEWAKQLLYVDESDPYACMTAEAMDAPPGAAGITFLPYLLGERAPVWDANARAVFFGLGRNHQRGDLIRAIFEGVGYSVLDIADRLREMGVRIERVSASGGLARLEPINQIKADMLGVPVQTTLEIETTALGAGLIALVCTGRFASLTEAVGACVQLGKPYEPQPARTQMYHDFFGVYRSLYEQLRGLFVERERLIGQHREVLRTKPTYTENL